MGENVKEKRKKNQMRRCHAYLLVRSLVGKQDEEISAERIHGFAFTMPINVIKRRDFHV